MTKYAPMDIRRLTDMQAPPFTVNKNFHAARHDMLGEPVTKLISDLRDGRVLPDDLAFAILSVQSCTPRVMKWALGANSTAASCTPRHNRYNLADFPERVRSGAVGRRTGLDRHPRIHFYNLYDAACVSDAPLVYDVDNVPVRARCTRSLAGPPGSK